MDLKRVVIVLAGLVITALLINALYQDGMAAFWRPFTDSASSALVTTDLTLYLILALIWVYHDAKQRGISPFPFIILMSVAPGVGVLTYLFLRLGDPSAGPIVNARR